MKKIQLFISYSHDDDSSRQEFDKWLVTLKDKGLIETWFDGYMIPGEQLMSKISQKIEEADVIVLLISQDYLASKSCKDEMIFALASTKLVIPIILKDCAWLETDCKSRLAVPKDGKSISKWEDKEEAWHSVYEGIKNAITELHFRFEVKQEYLEELQQVEFVTQNKERPKLDGIFIFPNLSKYIGAFEKEKLEFDYFLKKKDKSILIRGREFSGKTALTRWLFINLRGNYSPILINGDTIYKTKNFDDYFKREFSIQLNGDYEAWKQLDNKVAIIDNYHHKISPNIIKYLADNYVMTIIAMDDEEYMLYFKDEPSISEFTVVTLGQTSLVQQEELIRKWLRLNLNPGVQEIDDLEVDKLEEKVNNIITANRIVPRYPFFILSILQAFEAFMPSNYQITAYGHCYQALVTAQLVKKNIKIEDIDTCFNYLKRLAYDINDMG